MAKNITERSVLKERIYGHLSFWLVLWPLLTFITVIMAAGDNPLTQEAPYYLAAVGALGGMVALIPEFLTCAILLSILTVAIFHFAGTRKPSTLELLLEGVVAFIAMSLGIATQYPVVLDTFWLGPFRHYPVQTAMFVVLVAVLFLALVVALCSRQWKRAWMAPVTVGAFIAIGWSLTQLPTHVSKVTEMKNAVVLMGLDSLSQSDGLGQFKQFTAEQHGTYYTHAITTGLLTNAVWTSILMHRPVHETNVVFTFQSADWNHAPFQLVREAKKAGFETWSIFTDQFTSYVGSTAGFDYDRSSPMGWRQIATSMVKNSSILMPMLVSRLPQIPFSTTRPNQANTYCYNLKATIRRFLTVGTGTRRAFVAGHVEYLHQTAYPGMQDLSSEERALVIHASVDSLRDNSLHWYSPETTSEPLHINEWKEEHLQRVLTEELKETGFLDPARQNRLVVFSDHGHRRGLTNENFGDPRYYNVLLASFGASVVGDPSSPISVLEIPRILGFVDASRPALSPAVTEYVNLSTEEFKRAAKGTRVKMDGRLELPQEILSISEQRLKEFRPPSGEYSDVREIHKEEKPAPSENSGDMD
jgi:hypothetical protein